MSEKNIACVAKELGIGNEQVAAVARLFEEGATVPFIARYRKEVTGNLDEVMIIAVRDRLEQLRELDQRRETILKSLAEQNVLTPELEAAVKSAETLSALEDIYLPYRPKKRTRAMIAREKGLEPLALGMLNGELGDADNAAVAYVDAEKGVVDAEAALQGARDIIAEIVSEHAEARAEMRAHFNSQAQMSAKLVKGREKDAATYRDYFDWSEPATKAPSHRILAVLRAAEEGVLNVHFLPDEETAVEILKRRFVSKKNSCASQLELAVHDGYRRLMGPSLETETRNLCKQRADEEAIRVFAGNVRELLMASPLGEKTVLALDPGLRTGCKLVCLSRQGSLLFHTAIYPLEPHNRKEEAGAIIRKLCAEHRVEAIAVGNGTGGREALAFCKSLGLEGIILTMVSESGASVYSASEVARREFADYDVTVRGAVSIGRRLMDPLAELVKIDPKAIGVGQYQHDVDQKALKQSLEDVVSSCVNSVGVEVNTASGELLRHVAGLSPRMADAIVSYRHEHGPFKSRTELKKVSGVGPRSFEQAAGFLRIRGAKNPLDASAVHPERYALVERMAADLGCTVSDLMHDAGLRAKIDLKKYVSEDVGLPTLNDIMTELARPGRDPRREFELFSFDDNVNSLEDLAVGMKLNGVVTNITNFGAFVDIGVHQDGLVHISQIADSFVRDPHEVLKVQQKVQVTVLEIDMERKRISLSMKSNPQVN